MATFFGEVLSVYSRAVEEDDYDDIEKENEEDLQIRREIEEKSHKKCGKQGQVKELKRTTLLKDQLPKQSANDAVEVHIKWCPEVSKAVENSEKLQCSDLIIAVGPNAAGFVSAYVLSSESWTQVGWVSLWNEKSHGSTRPDTAPLPEESGCVFYQQKSCSSVLICQCTCYIAEDQLFQWAEKVLGSMQSRGLTVTVLSNSPLAEYKTPHYMYGNVAPFVRALKTSTFPGNLPCPLLEQPNIITGLPAAVLNQCQVQHIPAVLFQCFSDVLHPDSVTMETYKPALSNLSTRVKLETNPNMEILQKLTRVNDAHSNLYT